MTVVDEQNKLARALLDDMLMGTAPTANDRQVDELLAHPMAPVLLAAITQAMYGKGERHGGVATDFLEQPWAHYAKMHGRGFLTGQATKKLEEASSLRTGKAFETEMLGAIVYCAMAVLHEQSVTKGE